MIGAWMSSHIFGERGEMPRICDGPHIWFVLFELANMIQATLEVEWKADLGLSGKALCLRCFERQRTQLAWTTHDCIYQSTWNSLQCCRSSVSPEHSTTVCSVVSEAKHADIIRCCSTTAAPCKSLKAPWTVAHWMGKAFRCMAIHM